MSTVLPIFINVNRTGIPALRSLSVSVTTTQVAFDFNNHPTTGRAYRGLVILSLAQAIPAGTTGTLPVVLTSGGANAQALTTFNGDAVTVDNIPGTGVYIAWYESDTNTLQLLTGTIV